MTLYQFKQLSLREQAQSILEEGTLVGVRDEKELHLALYRIEDFYAEIHFNKSQDDIYRIRSFISDDQLQPYLEEIDITDLLKNI